MDRRIYQLDEYREKKQEAQKKKRTSKHCNLCSTKFSSKDPFIIFCGTCRDRNRELLRFSEWLPQGPEGFSFEDDAA